MTAAPITEEMLWRYHDGDLEPEERASVDEALRSNPDLRRRYELQAELCASRAATALALASPCPTELKARLRQALAVEAAGGPAPGRVLRVGNPLLKWALVASLAILLPTLYFLNQRSPAAGPAGIDPITEQHVAALFWEHREAVAGRLSFEPVPEGAKLAAHGFVRGIQIPMRSEADGTMVAALQIDPDSGVTFPDCRDCTVVDCPGLQLYGEGPEGPVSYFILPTAHLAVEQYPEEIAGGRGVRCTTSEGTSLIAWNEGPVIHGLVGQMSTASLMALLRPVETGVARLEGPLLMARAGP